MRRLPLVIAAFVALHGAAASAQALPVNASAELSVAAGQASYLNLGGAVRDIVVGDPSVADVSVVNDRTLVVLGKRAGVTSLLAFGASGRTLAARQIVVSEGGGVTVYRGVKASAYACGAQCTQLGGETGAAAAAPAAGTP
jgi:Flp pilus assembly secretin CpaC